MCDQCTMVIQLRAIIARADARIAELKRECVQWRLELRIYRETENKRIAELEQAVTVRDTDIARLNAGVESARHALMVETERMQNEINRIAQAHESDVEIRDTEIARLETDLELARIECAGLDRRVKSLDESLHALVEVSEDSTIALARAALNGDDDDEETEARAGNGGGA